MTSKAFSQNAFLDVDHSSGGEEERPEERRARKATVYDAVAGRLSATGFIPDYLVVASTRDTHSSSTLAVAPESVLFKGKNAPARYAESDMYFANEQSLRTQLPESDLLKALHCYISDFYARSGSGDDSADWQNMDETALLALGILMEESSREILGDTGDLVFTEGEDVDGLSKNFERQTHQARPRNASSVLSTPISQVKTSSTKRRRVESPNT